MRILRLFIGLTILLTFANPQLKAESGLDVNDVAVLFPIDGLHKAVPYIPLDDSTLLPSKVFADLILRAQDLSIAAPQTSSIIKASDWNVVAFRFDPCAPQDHGNSIEPCISELRLVAQTRARFSPADSSLHLIYQLKEGKPSATDDVLKDLRALKSQSETLLNTSSSGLPLGVHPLLAAAFKAKRDDVPALYTAFIRKYAKAENLKKLTMMGLRKGTPTDWIFFGGEIVDGQWAQTPAPNVKVKPGAGVELIIQGPNRTFEGTAIDSSLSLADFFGTAAENLETSVPVFNTTLHTLENPSLTDRNTVDCISCHAATSVRHSTDVTFAPVVDGVSAQSPKGITGFPAPGILPNHPLHWNMRAFGYFGLLPTVSMRAVHEAARSAEAINTILNLAPVGPDCSLVHDAVMSCFFDSSIPFGTVTPTAECLASCAAKPASQQPR